MGPRNLPSKSWTVNRGWVLTCIPAADLDAWTRLLGLYDQPDLRDAGLGTLGYRLWLLCRIEAGLTRRETRTVKAVTLRTPGGIGFPRAEQASGSPAPASLPVRPAAKPPT